MSRIGNKPIPVPKGIKVEIQGTHVTVTGPKGALERDIAPEIGLQHKDEMLVLSTREESKKDMALKGLTRTLVHNMVVGVGQGFKKILVIEGIGYKADVAGSVLTLNVGYSNPVAFALPGGIKADVDKANKITLESIDKELLGLTAARIRSIRKPEPYKGKGIRYESEHVVRKVGKSGAKK
jgi:large subunit ribosomal protein L6